MVKWGVRLFAIALLGLLLGSMLIAAVASLSSCQAEQQVNRRFRVAIEYLDSAKSPITVDVVTAPFQDPAEIYVIGGVPMAFYQNAEYTGVKRITMVQELPSRIDTSVSVSDRDDLH